MRWIVGGGAVTKQAASASQMGRFETEFLATDDSIAAVPDLPGLWIDRVHDRGPPKRWFSTWIRASADLWRAGGHGLNGHFGCTCYHPLFLFNQFGDLERCALRPATSIAPNHWRDVLEPVVARYRH